METPHALAPQHVAPFLFAGNARFTLVSRATSCRFTYQLAKCERGDVYFARVLVGPNNEADYAYMGVVRADYEGWQNHPVLRTTRKSSVGATAPSFAALAWYLRHLGDARVECHHEGRCGCCGRVLTVPESIVTGLGPVCAGRLAA